MLNMEDFVLNLLVVLIPICFYFYIYRFRNEPQLYKTLLYLLFSFSLILTMVFPIDLNGLIYDFRSIPIVLGSLYGGPIVSIIIYITLLLFRFLLGYSNNLLYAISVLPSFFIVILFNNSYNTLAISKKIVLAAVLCTLVKLITFTGYLSLTGHLNTLFKKPLETLETYLLQGFTISLCVYILEFLIKYFHLQEEIISSQKAKIVSNMAASVAHEIRNPLTSLRGFIQLLGRDNLTSEKRQFYVEICLEELDRAQQIITDYLSIAKPGPEILENINLFDELSYISNVLQTYAAFNQVEISFNTRKKDDFRIVGDKQKLRQALLNIGKNAIEAMPDGGILSFDLNQINNNIQITIADTGTGMTNDQIARLGFPYFSTKEKGTGLGTIIAFGIIKEMKGIIEVQSEVGKGTKFLILFNNNLKNTSFTDSTAKVPF